MANIGQEKVRSNNFKQIKNKLKKEIKNIEVFYEIVDFFVFDLCFKPLGATKPIFCSKVAQKCKICWRLLEPPKFAPNAKSCRTQLGKAYHR